MWPFRRNPDPEPEGVSFPETPIASILVDLINMGLTAPQAVYVVHLLETAQSQAELRIRAEMNLQAAQTPKPRATRPATTPTRRKRAEYFRKYRARNKLRLVVAETRNQGSDDAA